MSTLVPRLTLFPLYPGGRRIETGGGLNANSRFRTQETAFTPSYGVNVPSTTQPDYSHYLSVRPDLRLQNNPISQADYFNRVLDLNFRNTSPVQSGTTPADAPAAPTRYQEQLSYYTVSDQQYATLVAQPEFRIPKNGLGFRVTTDGMGGIAGIETAPSFQKAAPPMAATDPVFLTQNRAKITEGAVFKTDPAPGKPFPALPPMPTAPRRSDFEAQGLLAETGLAAGQRLEGPVFGGLSPGLSLLASTGLNPVIERLIRLQPEEGGMVVTGTQAELGPEAARDLAATRSGYNLEFSDSFAATLKGLQQTALSQSGPPSALQMARRMDGFIPMAPVLPAPPKTSADTGGFAGTMERFAQGASANIEDPTAKKGSGGYIPFRLSSGMSGGGGMGSGGAGAQQQPRKRFSMTA